MQDEGTGHIHVDDYEGDIHFEDRGNDVFVLSDWPDKAKMAHEFADFAARDMYGERVTFKTSGNEVYVIFRMTNGRGEYRKDGETECGDWLLSLVCGTSGPPHSPRVKQLADAPGEVRVEDRSP